MHYAVVHPKYHFSPIAVFSDDPRKVVNDFLDTSDDCKNATRDFTIEQVEVLRLDPGGALNTREPFKQFEVDGHQFEAQLSKTGELTWLLDAYGKYERLPGMVRFRNFSQNVIISRQLLNNLRAKLADLSKSDEALHAQITDAATKESIEKNGNGGIFFASIPRE